MEMLTNYLVPVIVVLCLCVGYVIKHWIKDADNKIIPTVVTFVGIAASVAMNWGALTVEIVVGGAVSGLASTGLHQLLKQWIDNGAN
jgi:uncharacterized membrane protein